MGEIKSTLDLVMERTRNLSMTAEEKDRQRKADFEKRLQGLLNKYADGLLSMDVFLVQITELQVELKVPDHQEVMKAVLARIDPDQNSQLWLDLVERLAPEVGDPLKKILAEYHQKKNELLATGQHQMREQLAQDHGINGSAVMPNPLKNIEFKENLSGLKQKTRAEIEAI